MPRIVPIHSETITLGSFLKWAHAVSTGGEAKQALAAGQVQVNGTPETRRGRQLLDGDRVRFGTEEFVVRYEP